MEQAIQKSKQVAFTGKAKRIIVDVICWLFIFLFMHTAVGKILDLENFGNSLKRYPILIEYVQLLKWGIPLIEIAVSALLVIPKTRRIGLWSSLALMLAFTGFLLYINTTKEASFCSCNGVISSLNAQQHVWFNIVFIALAIIGILLSTSSFRPKRRNLFAIIATLSLLLTTFILNTEDKQEQPIIFEYEILDEAEYQLGIKKQEWICGIPLDIETDYVVPFKTQFSFIIQRINRTTNIKYHENEKLFHQNQRIII